MTTATSIAAALAAAADCAADDPLAASYPAHVLIPLAEFGQWLENPGLDRWFEGFAGRNQDQADYEITAQGELKMMMHPGIPYALHQYQLAADVGMWARNCGGIACGPTSCFVMPDRARFGPDSCWISAERWHNAPPESREPPFVAVIPEFVAEIVSPSNRGPELLDNVQRYLAAGALLIWVINARRRQVTIYRPNADPEILHDPETLHGESVMPGFAFNVRQRIFDYNP